MACSDSSSIASFPSRSGGCCAGSRATQAEFLAHERWNHSHIHHSHIWRSLNMGNFAKSKALQNISSRVTQAHYTICPVFVASNVAAELGWLDEEFKLAGAHLGYLRSLPDNIGWLPHFSHKLDNLFRDGGNIPSIWAHADVTRTKLIGLTAAHAGGQILVRTDSGINKVADLKGRKIGLAKSRNAAKVDWWRGTAERGIELALDLASLKRSDVEIVNVEHDDSFTLEPASKPSEIWAIRRLKEDLSLNPEILALEERKVDAIYSNAGRAQHLERTGKFKVIEDLARHPDWTLQVANSPYAITVNAELAETRPEVVVAFLRATVRAGRWINANRAAAAEILHRVTFHPTLEDTVRAIADTDFIPNLSPKNLAGIEIEKAFLLSHGYIKKDFEVSKWADARYLEDALGSL
ncbi:MAG: ABC transporter substrate-binding protein [Telluria sp.]